MCSPIYLGIKTDADTVEKKPLIPPPDVDARVGLGPVDSIDYPLTGAPPVQRYAKRLGKIVAGADRDYAHSRVCTGCHDSVDGFIDAAIPARDQYVPGPAFAGNRQLVDQAARRAGLGRGQAQAVLPQAMADFIHQPCRAATGGESIGKQVRFAAIRHLVFLCRSIGYCNPMGSVVRGPT